MTDTTASELTEGAPPVVVVHPSAELLARGGASRLLLTLIDAQSVASPVHIALTGGSIVVSLLEQVAQDPLTAAVDWSAVHVWWGDERFVPEGHEERNERDARAALLAQVPLPAANIHTMPGPDRAPDVQSAAADYTRELAAHAPAGAVVPEFAALVLGMGPDGHVASLFPGHASLDVTEVGAIAEPDSPKPPPERISLTLAALRSARQVWLVVSGESKAPAVAAALTGSGLVDEDGTEGPKVPAGMVRGRLRTLWLLDLPAATSLPA